MPDDVDPNGVAVNGHEVSDFAVDDMDLTVVESEHQNHVYSNCWYVGELQDQTNRTQDLASIKKTTRITV